MGDWIYLSHFLNSTVPAYGGGETFQSAEQRSIMRGDTCNTSSWIMPNHIGTHIDFPRHFVENGKSLSDYSPEFWIMNHAHLIDVSPIAASAIIDEALLNIDATPKDTDILFIKTGFGKLRDDACYWNAGPVFMPEIADALRRRCPNIRIMGFDTISLSSWSDRHKGRTAHKAFLNNVHPILLLEDMNLDMVKSATLFQRVIVSPLCVSDADASPCTVLAEVKA
jgi:arylformamidase